MSDHQGWPIRELWEKYEEITMHFNDLIIRLRTQALAGVAALSTLVGIFAKADLGAFSYTWEIAGFVFAALALFWIAIWVLDFAYYNQLLIGSVAALLELEKEIVALLAGVGISYYEHFLSLSKPVAMQRVGEKI
jgi:hypothetical protein